MNVVFPSFAALEAMLAHVHGIASDKRTAFQSRLKNFQRLGFPADVPSIKGKSTQYPARAIFEMALAVELTQLGMRPESIINLLTRNSASVAIVAKEVSELLLSKPKLHGRNLYREVEGIYLIFDPRALESMMENFPSDDYIFMARSSELADNLGAFTEGLASRAAVVNITSLLDLISPAWDDASPIRQVFLEEVRDWALGVITSET